MIDDAGKLRTQLIESSEMIIDSIFIAEENRVVANISALGTDKFRNLFDAGENLSFVRDEWLNIRKITGQSRMENNRLSDFGKKIENWSGVLRAEQNGVDVGEVDTADLVIIKGVADVHEAGTVAVLKPRFIEGDDIGATGNVENHMFYYST